MKNILLSLATLTILAACNSKADLSSDPKETTIRNLPFYNNSVFTDTAKTDMANEPPAKITQTRRKPAATKHNVNVAAPNSNTAPVYTPEASAGPRVVTAPVATAPVPSSTTDNGDSASAGTGSSSSAGTVSTIPGPEKKKGWSKAAKGAVIGAGAGAIGGAIISKKKGLGAIVGGVVGAAGGYIIGKGMDKKDNRFTTN